jgi:hypothetical protein
MTITVSNVPLEIASPWSNIPVCCVTPIRKMRTTEIPPITATLYTLTVGKRYGGKDRENIDTVFNGMSSRKTDS